MNNSQPSKTRSQKMKEKTKKGRQKMKERVKMKKTRQKINSRMKKNRLIKRTKGRNPFIWNTFEMANH